MLKKLEECIKRRFVLHNWGASFVERPWGNKNYLGVSEGMLLQHFPISFWVVHCTLPVYSDSISNSLYRGHKAYFVKDIQR
jgi:hypothetical protein